jgi:hypothetical protein
METANVQGFAEGDRVVARFAPDGQLYAASVAEVSVHCILIRTEDTMTIIVGESQSLLRFLS